MTEIQVPRLVIEGTTSGVGKTTIAVGLMAALVRRGLIRGRKCKARTAIHISV